MFWGLLDPDPYPLFTCMDPDPDHGLDPDPSIIMPKIVRKNIDSYHFVALFDFLSLKNDVNTFKK
jgi:hypothetical protein